MILIKVGLAPLHVASEKGHLDVVKTLLKYQARGDVFDEVRNPSHEML